MTRAPRCCGFIPTERAFRAIDLTENTRVQIRAFDREESRYLIEGRPVAAAFFDLVFVLERNAGALISLPRIESYLEARFWSEIFRTLDPLLRTAIFPESSIASATRILQDLEKTRGVNDRLIS